jgi:hypothetical protein
MSLPYFPAHKTHFSRKMTNFDLRLINTHTSIIQHLYRDYDCSGSDDDFLRFYDQ